MGSKFFGSKSSTAEWIQQHLKQQLKTSFPAAEHEGNSLQVWF